MLLRYRLVFPPDLALGPDGVALGLWSSSAGGGILCHLEPLIDLGEPLLGGLGLIRLAGLVGLVGLPSDLHEKSKAFLTKIIAIVEPKLKKG